MLKPPDAYFEGVLCWPINSSISPLAIRLVAFQWTEYKQDCIKILQTSLKLPPNTMSFDLISPDPRVKLKHHRKILGAPRNPWENPKRILGTHRKILGIRKKFLGTPWKILVGTPRKILGIPTIILETPRKILGIPKNILGIPKKIIGIPRKICAVPVTW